MKKVLKRVTASLMSGLMLFGSTYVVASSVSAVSNEIQPRGMWAVYGDVNNDGNISGLDISYVTEAINIFENLTGDSRLPLSYAVARPTVYFGEIESVPQAADIDGDGYITDNDVRMISLYCVNDSYGGRCGQPFYIN